MFKPWPKIPRLENEVYHITEKIDGTNACIIIKQTDDLNEVDYPDKNTIYTNKNQYNVWAQSRTRLITPENDNFDFAKWVKENAEQLINDLGEGYHYGEWWGQGIQRGYDLKEKRFSLFNPTKISAICYNVPMLMTPINQVTLQPMIEQLVEDLKLSGSYAAPGYMRPEGLIVYAEKAKTYWKVIIDK